MQKAANVNMITLAREERGLTITELAEKINLSQGNLSKIESNLILSISEEIVEKIATVLNYPVSFFYQEGEVYKPTLYYRRRIQVSQKLLYKIEAGINIYRLNIEKLLRQIDLPEVKIPSYDVVEIGTAKTIAKLVRQDLRLPKGPIKNMIKVLESLGVIVVKYQFESDKVDGLSLLTGYNHPIIFLNNSYPPDRQRFTLAHEFGHLVMHLNNQITGERDIEDEANKFASEFLVPEEEILPHFRTNRITLNFLADLKRYWKVSIASLLYKTSDLGIIDGNQLRYLWSQYSKADFKLREPRELDPPMEETLNLKEILNLYKSELGYSDSDLSELLNISENDFYRKFVAERGNLRVL